MNNWKALLAKKCIPFKIQPVVTIDKVTFYCPVEPKGETKAQLIQSLPHDLQHEFLIQPKPQTMEAVTILLLTVGGTVISSYKTLTISLPETSDTIPIHEIIQDINDILSIDEYFESWSIRVGDQVTIYTLAQAKAQVNVNQELGKHTTRAQAISDDDLLNLKIMLETMDVSTFISSI
jgi:hypothetical protein